MTDFIQPWAYLDRAAKLYPNRAGIADLDRTVSYTALTLYAKQMAAMFRARGVRPGDFVALNLPTLTQTVATFAVFHEAAVFVPYLASVVDDPAFGVAWVVTVKPVPGFPLDKQIVVDQDWMKQMSRESATGEPIPYESKDSLIRMAFSSGTTGTPKGIPYSAEFAATRATSLELLKKAGRGKAISLMAPRRGAGWNWWYASFVNQTTYLIVDKPDDAVEMLRRFKLEGVHGSPAQYRVLAAALRRSGATLPQLQHIFSAGSALPPRLVEELQQLTNATVYNSLGATEVGTIATTEGTPDEPGYVGEILPSADVEIVDPESHAPLPDGQEGVLRVRKPVMATEYYNDPAATALAFRDGWFYPGDYARRVGNRLYLAGRVAERINIGGVKMDPAQIDSMFVETGLVEDCVAFTVVGSSGLDEVHLAYIATEPVDEAKLASVLADDLREANPRRFHRVTDIPRTEMGKPIRRLLAERFSVS